MSMDWEAEYFKMSILPKLVHKFNASITKIITPFLKKRNLKSKKNLYRNYRDSQQPKYSGKKARGPRI